MRHKPGRRRCSDRVDNFGSQDPDKRDFYSGINGLKMVDNFPNWLPIKKAGGAPGLEA